MFDPKKHKHYEGMNEMCMVAVEGDYGRVETLLRSGEDPRLGSFFLSTE